MSFVLNEFKKFAFRSARRRVWIQLQDTKLSLIDTKHQIQTHLHVRQTFFVQLRFLQKLQPTKNPGLISGDEYFLANKVLLSSHFYVTFMFCNSTLWSVFSRQKCNHCSQKKKFYEGMQKNLSWWNAQHSRKKALDSRAAIWLH